MLLAQKSHAPDAPPCLSAKSVYNQSTSYINIMIPTHTHTHTHTHTFCCKQSKAEGRSRADLEAERQASECARAEASTLRGQLARLKTRHEEMMVTMADLKSLLQAQADRAIKSEQELAEREKVWREASHRAHDEIAALRLQVPARATPVMHLMASQCFFHNVSHDTPLACLVTVFIRTCAHGTMSKSQYTLACLSFQTRVHQHAATRTNARNASSLEHPDWKLCFLMPSKNTLVKVFCQWNLLVVSCMRVH
jgi:hypothetical protein